MDTPADRLKTARANAGFEDAKAACRAHGWGYEAYKKHEAGENGIRQSVAERYATAFGVTAQWLLFGGNNPGSPGRGPMPKFKLLPLWTMGEIARMGMAKPPEAVRQTAIDAGLDIGVSAFCVELEDASMTADPAVGPDNFNEGDLAAFDPDKPVRPGDYVLFRFAGEPIAVFRRYRGRAGHEYPFDLVPLNSAWATETISDPKQGELLGRLIRHIRVF